LATKQVREDELDKRWLQNVGTFITKSSPEKLKLLIMKLSIKEASRKQFLRVFTLLLSLSALSISAHGQDYLKSDGEVNKIIAVPENYQDFILPVDNTIKELNLEIEGADGGWIEYNYYDRFRATRTQRVNGGQGAVVSVTYEIGQGIGNIAPGSLLRFIVGNRAEREKIDEVPVEGIGAGGGGGTAVLISKDQGINWQLLLVAGGGGGGAIKVEDEEIKSSPGLPGVVEVVNTTHTYTRQVRASGSAGDGGEFHQLAGGGGGAFTDGKYDKGMLYYGNAGWKNKRFGEKPLGGLGGTQEGARDGGWGFGGGGSGHKGGGGGGGYSGGGAGLPGYGGIGGSSFVERTIVFPLHVSKQQSGNTDNPGDGHVRYQLIKK
nr:hypothetical protein [Saprospiraceae bacterium]